MSEFKVCKVINTDDEHGQGLIQVYYVPIDGIYKHKKDGVITYDYDKIKWCAPLLPRVFGVTPKVGENVVVTEFSGQRWYIGPIYGQLTNLDYAVGSDVTSFMPGADCAPPANPENNKEIKGALPEKDDVSINGKGETGLYFKQHDAVLHAGIKVSGGKSTLSRNKKGDESFIQLSHPSDDIQSTATIVADKINLFGNKKTCANDNFDVSLLHDINSSIISQENLATLMANAKSVPYGEDLVNVLGKIIVALLNHVHPIGNKPPIVANTDLEKLTGYVFERDANAMEDNLRDNKKMYDYAYNSNTDLSDEILSPNIKIN